MILAILQLVGLTTITGIAIALAFKVDRLNAQVKADALRIGNLIRNRHTCQRSQYRVRVPGTTLDSPLYKPFARFAGDGTFDVSVVEVYNPDDAKPGEFAPTLHVANLDLRAVCVSSDDELYINFQTGPIA